MFQPTWLSLSNTKHMHVTREVNCKIKSYKINEILFDLIKKIHNDRHC